MPQSPLSHLPGPRRTALVARARRRHPARALLPYRLYPAARDRPNRLIEPHRRVQPPVPHRHRDPAHHRRRYTSRRNPYWRHRGPAYLESVAPVPSPSALRRPQRRLRCRHRPVENRQRHLLRPRQSPRKPLPTPIPRELARAHAHGRIQCHGTIAHLANPAQFHAVLATARSKDWNVYAKRPFRNTKQVFRYLSRYTTGSPSATAASPASTQTTSRSGIENPPGTDTENLATPSPPSPPRSSSAASCSTPYRADCIASATSASSPTAAGHKPSTSLVKPSASPNKTTTQKRAILRAQPRTKALTTTPATSSRLVPVPTVAGCFAACGKSPYSASASHRATHPVPSRRNPIRDDTSLWIRTSRRRPCAGSSRCASSGPAPIRWQQEFPPVAEHDSPKHPKTARAGLLERTAMPVILRP